MMYIWIRLPALRFVYSVRDWQGSLGVVTYIYGQPEEEHVTTPNYVRCVGKVVYGQATRLLIMND